MIRARPARSTIAARAPGTPVTPASRPRPERSRAANRARLPTHRRPLRPRFPRPPPRRPRRSRLEQRPAPFSSSHVDEVDVDARPPRRVRGAALSLRAAAGGPRADMARTREPCRTPPGLSLAASGCMGPDSGRRQYLEEAFTILRFRRRSLVSFRRFVILPARGDDANTLRIDRAATQPVRVLHR